MHEVPTTNNATCSGEKRLATFWGSACANYVQSRMEWESSGRRLGGFLVLFRGSHGMGNMTCFWHAHRVGVWNLGLVSENQLEKTIFLLQSWPVSHNLVRSTNKY